MDLLFSPLVLVTFFPLIGLAILFFIPANQKNAVRWTALITSLLTFLIALWVLSKFDRSVAQPQLAVNFPWVNLGGLPIHFYLAVDGLSMMMVLKIDSLNYIRVA